MEQHPELDLLTDDTDPEWAQIREMEEFLSLQRTKLLQQGVPESDDNDWESSHWPTEDNDVTDVDKDDDLEEADMEFITSILESFSKPKQSTKLTESCCKHFPPEGGQTQLHWPTEDEDFTDDEEDDDLEDTDMAFITSTLDSFSNPKPSTKPRESCYKHFSPEGAATQAAAKLMMPHNFNQKSMIKTSTTGKFSYFPTLPEEGALEFTPRRIKATSRQKNLSLRTIFKASAASLKKRSNPS